MQPKSYRVFKWVIYALATLFLCGLQNMFFCHIRVLGLNATVAKVLSMAKGQTALPLSHSLARLERLGGRAEAFTALEARAADLYGLLCPAVPPCGMDYTNSIITL